MIASAMIILAAALLFAALLFWFGLVRSHWIAPAALFAASGPVVAAFSWNHDAIQIAMNLVATLLLFYTAFGCGRWAAENASSISME